jgi:hypothetical protein
VTALLIIAAALALLAAVAVPIVRDLPWEHEGATERWSPMASFGPAVTTHEFRTGTGWPA